MNAPANAPARVAVGVVHRNGKILLCRRRADARYPLKWEFPGGKAREGESLEAALARELMEELGVEVVAARRAYSAVNRYADGGEFAVTYFLVDEYSGAPRNRAFSQMKWEEIDDLANYDMLEGNEEIVRNIRRWMQTPG